MSKIKNRIHSILIAMACVLIMAGDVGAQEGQPQARKFNEFIGEVDNEHLMALLDNFAIEFQKHPDAQAHIIVYRTRSDPPAVGHRYAFKAKDYLISVRGVDKRRVITVDGGMTGCLTYELWIVPPGAPPPERRYTYKYSLNGSIDSKFLPKPKPRKSGRK